MDVIYLPQLLQKRERKEEIQFNEPVSGLPTLTPVKGSLIVRHGGNFLEVSAKAETIVTLTCDRCCQNYNHRLAIDTSEIILLEEPPLELLSEKEVALEDLTETLSPRGYFQPDSWLYEQLSLAMPMRQLCDLDCQGTPSSEPTLTSHVDSRWASLAALKEQLSSNHE